MPRFALHVFRPGVEVIEYVLSLRTSRDDHENDYFWSEDGSIICNRIVSPFIKVERIDPLALPVHDRPDYMICYDQRLEDNMSYQDFNAIALEVLDKTLRDEWKPGKQIVLRIDKET